MRLKKNLRIILRKFVWKVSLRRHFSFAKFSTQKKYKIKISHIDNIDDRPPLCVLCGSICTMVQKHITFWHSWCGGGIGRRLAEDWYKWVEHPNCWRRKSNHARCKSLLTSYRAFAKRLRHRTLTPVSLVQIQQALFRVQVFGAPYSTCARKN